MLRRWPCHSKLHCTAVLTKEIVYGFNIESDIVVYLSVVWGLGRDHDLEVPRNYLSCQGSFLDVTWAFHRSLKLDLWIENLWLVKAELKAVSFPRFTWCGGGSLVPCTASLWLLVLCRLLVYLCCAVLHPGCLCCTGCLCLCCSVLAACAVLVACVLHTLVAFLHCSAFVWYCDAGNTASMDLFGLSPFVQIVGLFSSVFYSAALLDCVI